MRISYVPMHTQVDIFFPLASATRLSAEWRIGVIQTLVQMGHEVEICGKIEKKQKQVLDLILSGDLPMAHTHMAGAKDYLFYKSVKFNETGYPEDADVLLIEGGATNSFHTRMFNGSQCTIQQYAYECVCRHKGRVFWFCPEPDYAFRFGDLKMPTGKAAPATDLRRLLYSSKKFLEDKKFVWLMTDHDKEAFRKHSSIPNDFPLENIAFAPYSLAEPEICAPAMELLPMEELEWDVVYIGHTAGDKERKRREQLERLFKGVEKTDLRVAIYGQQEPGWDIPGVSFYGKTANMGMARWILNHSLMTPLVIRHDFIQTQHESNRQAQAAQCACLPIWPKEVRWMDVKNYVDNIEEIAKLVKFYRETPKLRAMGVQYFRQYIPKFSEWLPKVLALEGSPIEDIWHKDLEPLAADSQPTLL